MNGKSALAKIAALSAVAMALCIPANAADLGARPYYAKSPPPPLLQPLYNWTGFYVGAHFGGAFSSEDESLGAISTDPSGVLGGLQLGYNYQFAPNMLVGIEGELSWTSASGTANFSTGPTAVSFKSDHNWYDTLAGRFGIVQNNWLFYAKLGVAWMNADYSISAAPFGTASINSTRNGWTIGAGAEYMLAPNWSAKIEYSYLDFGGDGFVFGITPAGVGSNINTQIHEIKVGMNYHLPPGILFGRW
jgi:outer membrane immunogenic protein